MPERRKPLYNRRDWFRLGVGALCLPTLVRADDRGEGEGAEVEAKGKKAGLGGFGRSETEHYLGLGNASPAFRLEATTTCETLADDFFKHFRDKGFTDLTLPKQKLTLV